MNSGIACKSLYKVCRNDQSTIHLSVVYGKFLSLTYAIVMIRMSTALLFILLLMLGGCTSINHFFHSRQVQKFEKQAYDPGRKMSKKDINISKENEKKNRIQDQRIEENSGGINVNRVKKANKTREDKKKKK